MKLALIWLLLLMAAIGSVASEGQSVPDGTILGHVYDANTKQPLSQAFVYCQDLKCAKPTTNGSGYYTIERCFSPSKAYTIQCSRHNYKTATSSATTDINGKAVVDFNLEQEEPDINDSQTDTLESSQETNRSRNDAMQWNEKGVSIISQSSCDSCSSSSTNCACVYEGLEIFEKATKLDPSFADVWSNKGLALLMLGRYDEAILACNKAIELTSSIDISYWRYVVLWHAWATKADALWSKGSWEESRVASKNIEIFYNKAKIQIGKDYRMPWLIQTSIADITS